MRRTLLFLSLTILGTACQLGGAARPTVRDTVAVIPGTPLPPEVEVMTSNNNLDVIEHAGRVFLAFRTAPWHFASDQTKMYVVSSDPAGLGPWRFEAEFFLKTDVREPRFLSLNDKLFIYFARLGVDPKKFEPGQMLYSVRDANGTWSKPEEIFEKGFIPWRIVWYREHPLLVGYTGGENIYNESGGELEVHLLTTDDGVHWRAYNPQRQIVHRGGGSETSIAFDSDGRLFAVMRNEAGDSSGFGSKICTAPPEDITDWQCVTDRRKYDSPLLFEQDGEFYLIGRRNLTDTGNYDLGFNYLPTQNAKRYTYLADYSGHPKRCSLWQIDKSSLGVSFVLDFPSKGDTCFPSIIRRNEHAVWVYNYSSPPEQSHDPTWIEGQLEQTKIYRSELEFP